MAKKATVLTDPRLPGKKYKTQQGLDRALARLDEGRPALQAAPEPTSDVVNFLDGIQHNTVSGDPDMTPAIAAYLANQGLVVEDVPEQPAQTGPIDLDSLSTRELEQILQDRLAKAQVREHTEAVQEASDIRKHRIEAPGEKYIRATGSSVAIRLQRHGKDENRIFLRGRGERGDMAPIQRADLNDYALRSLLAIGAVEIITSAEAAEIMSKQLTNQQAVHPALAMIQNERGENEGEMKLSVTDSFENQGTTVAHLNDGQVVFDRSGIGGRVQRPEGAAPATPAGVQGAQDVQGYGPAAESADYLSNLRANTEVGPKRRS